MTPIGKRDFIMRLLCTGWGEPEKARICYNPHRISTLANLVKEMASQNLTGRYFADALNGRRDITDSYLALGDIPQLVGISSQNEDRLVAAIRRLIESDTNGINTIESLSGPSLQEARGLYLNNSIAAVDGTDAISSLQFASDTIYAAGIILVTPQTQHRPRAHVTRTHATHLTPAENIGVPWMQAIREWHDYLREARLQEHSWINTFREYEEREIAYSWLQESEEHFVLIDGPILTQNMLTQDAARDLLQAIVESSQAIGFIKNLTANPLLSAIGYALRQGEVFVLSQWSTVLSERFGERQQQISQWILDHAGEVVRAIYKVNHKAFGIECVAEQIPLALAILKHDNGGTLNHDIPMLLQIADKHVRTRFNGSRSRDEVIARFSSDDSERFVALTNERSLR